MKKNRKVNFAWGDKGFTHEKKWHKKSLFLLIIIIFSHANYSMAGKTRSSASKSLLNNKYLNIASVLLGTGGVVTTLVCKKKIKKNKEKTKFLEYLKILLKRDEIDKEFLTSEKVKKAAEKLKKSKLLEEIIRDNDNLKKLKRKDWWNKFGFWGGIGLLGLSSLYLLSSGIKKLMGDKEDESQDDDDEKDKKKNQMPNFTEKLCDDELAMVLSFLDTKDAYIISRTNKRFRNLVTDYMNRNTFPKFGTLEIKGIYELKARVRKFVFYTDELEKEREFIREHNEKAERFLESLKKMLENNKREIRCIIFDNSDFDSKIVDLCHGVEKVKLLELLGRSKENFNAVRSFSWICPYSSAIRNLPSSVSTLETDFPAEGSDNRFALVQVPLGPDKAFPKNLRELVLVGEEGFTEEEKRVLPKRLTLKKGSVVERVGEP